MPRYKLLALLLLSACALRAPPAALLDLGPPPAPLAAPASAQPYLRLSEVQAPPWLEETRFYYRLLYNNPQQPRPYHASRWLMPPHQLLEQRLRQDLADAGFTVLPATDARSGASVLRIELEDFTQNFSTPASSTGRVLLRASLYTGRQLRWQRPFYAQVPAGSADAAGGARALADASELAIRELIRWIQAQPFNP